MNLIGSIYDLYHITISYFPYTVAMSKIISYSDIIDENSKNLSLN